jgi:hypothetical protein
MNANKNRKSNLLKYLGSENAPIAKPSACQWGGRPRSGLSKVFDKPISLWYSPKYKLSRCRGEAFHIKNSIIPSNEMIRPYRYIRPAFTYQGGKLTSQKSGKVK